MDPVYFNYLVSMWGKPESLSLEDALIKIELDIAQYVKEQQTLKQLKQNVGIV